MASTKPSRIRALGQPAWRWHLALLTIMGAFFWGTTMPGRTDGLGQIPTLIDGSWKSLTVHSLGAARNWHNLGFFHMKGLLVLERLSIETTGPENQPWDLPAYSSYSSAYMVPVAFYQYLAGRPVSLAELELLSLTTHLAVVILAAWLVYFLCRPASARWALACATLTAVLGTWHFCALYFLGHCWWPDLAVLPAIPLFYLAMLLCLSGRPGNAQHFGLAGVVFAGTSLDWSFSLHVALTAALLFWKEMAEARGFPRRPRFSGTWAALLGPFALAHLIFLIQLLWFGNPEGLVHSFLKRAAQEAGGPALEEIIRRMLGSLNPGWADLPLAVTLLLAVFCLGRDLRRLRNGPSQLTFVLTPAAFGVLLHVALLREHYMDHIYEWTKLAFLYSLAPIAIILVPERRRRHAFALACVACILASIGQNAVYNRFKLGRVLAGEEVEHLAKFVDDNTGYDDVLFSPGFSFVAVNREVLSPEELKWARAPDVAHKFAHHIEKLTDVRTKLDELFEGSPKARARARIRLLVELQELPAWEKQLAGLPHVTSSRGHRIYSLP